MSVITVSPYLTCAHCGCEFLATDRQLKRSRSSGYSGKSYCSSICLSSNLPRRPTRTDYRGVCPTCGLAFNSKYAKIYCSMKCYTSSEIFLKRIRAQAITGSAARILALTGKLPQPKVEIICINCGTTKIVNASKANGKYCNQRCYRQYMAMRFDRWIASPQSIALPQGYDEFLSQEELPCLIEGCDWVGVHLGNHVNLAHGIPVEEFKRAAGFNTTTGLVTPAVSEKLSDRSHLYNNVFGGALCSKATGGRPITRNYKSLEGREHSAKARALMIVGSSEVPRRICVGCGKEYQPGPIAYNSKFCSTECRENWYQRNRKNTRFWMKCHTCLKDFQGLIGQKRRFERGKKVFCGIHCRQIHNGKAARQQPPAQTYLQPE